MHVHYVQVQNIQLFTCAGVFIFEISRLILLLGDPDCNFCRGKKILPVIKEYWALMDLPYQWSRILGPVNNFSILIQWISEIEPPSSTLKRIALPVVKDA